MVEFELVFSKLGLDIEIKDGAVNCPFHEDRLPSCVFNHETGIYHCFSCNRGGNSIKFFKDYNREFNGAHYSYKECKLMLEGRQFIDPSEIGKINLEFNRVVKLVPFDSTPFYMRFSGIDRIKSIQGYPVSREIGIKMLLD